MKTAFFRIIGDDKATILRRAVRSGAESDSCRFDRGAYTFGDIPKSPLAYWVGEGLKQVFRDNPTYGSQDRAVKQGLATADDFRFVRLKWEIQPLTTEKPWKTYPKGGEFSPYYADLPLVVAWGRSRNEMHSNLNERGDIRSNIWMLKQTEEEYFFRGGLTYPRRLHRLAVAPLPRASIISVRGSGIFAPHEHLLRVTALFSSSAFDFFVKCMLGRFGHPQFDNGTLALTPIPKSFPDAPELDAPASKAIMLKRCLDTVVEVSHAFVVPALLQIDGDSFDHRVSSWAERVAGVEAELERVQFEIDELCFELYGISDEDRRAITEGFGVTDTDDEAADDSDEDESDAGVELDPVGLAAGLVSWAVGVAVGRFDVRLATGGREWPVEPDPFDPLPVCSPGMLTGADGLPATSLPEGYPLVPSPVLVDDPGHELDITARVRGVFDVVFGDDADIWWSDIGAALDARNGVEGWLRRGFFDHHLKTYSKSRRKAPLMWPIGTKSGAYQVWLYAHSVTPDSLFRLLGDVIEPKLAAEQRQLSDLTQEFGPSPTASQRRSLDVQQRLVDEITELCDEIRAVAALWHPDLNDGIVIVLAPLWRLFVQHRAWAKELKDRWVKLAKGDYDWAQLAMHIWPERVIPKCATDRSLAIAHNLEDTFWAQDDTNPDKWHPRHTPTTPIDQLTADRTNPTTTNTRNHPTP